MSFGVVKELLKHSENFMIILAMTISGLLLFMKWTCSMATSGSQVTDEAKQTRVIFSKILIEVPEENQKKRKDFLYLMTQLRSRNVNVQNSIFIINHNVILAVRPNNLF